MSKFKVGDEVWCIAHGRGKVTDILAPHNILAGGLEVEVRCAEGFLRFTSDGYARRSDHAPSLYHLTDLGEGGTILTFIRSKNIWRIRTLFFTFALVTLTLLANTCIALIATAFNLPWWCDVIQALVLDLTITIFSCTAWLFSLHIYSSSQQSNKRS